MRRTNWLGLSTRASILLRSHSYRGRFAGGSAVRSSREARRRGGGGPIVRSELQGLISQGRQGGEDEELYEDEEDEPAEE